MTKKELKRNPRKITKKTITPWFSRLFRSKLRLHKSFKIKTDSGVEEPSLLISNAAWTIFRDIAIYGFAVDK